MLEDESIESCSNVADIEHTKTVFVVCHGQIAPHLRQDMRPDLFLLAFSAQGVGLELVSFKKIQQSPLRSVSKVNKFYVNQVGFEG